MKTIKNIITLIGDILGYLILFWIYYTNRLIKSPLWFLKVDSFKEWNQNTPQKVERKVKDTYNLIALIVLLTTYYFTPTWLFWTITTTLTLTILAIGFYLIKRNKQNN